MSIKSLGIIGAGELGNTIANHLAPEGVEVFQSDSRQEANFSDKVTITDDEEVLQSDVIVLATPVQSYPDVFRVVDRYVKPGSTIFEVGSVKMATRTMLRDSGLLDRPDIEVVESHPLLGPDIIEAAIAAYTAPTEGDLELAAEGQLVIPRVFDGLMIAVTTEKLKRGGKGKELLRYWQDKLGIGSIEITDIEHDKQMAIQALDFAILQAAINTGLEFDIDAPTPLTRQMANLIRVMTRHSAELIETIEKYNPFAARIRANYLAAFAAFNSSVKIIPRGLDGANPEDSYAARTALRRLVAFDDDAIAALTAHRRAVTDHIGDINSYMGLPMRDPEQEAAKLAEQADRAARFGLPVVEQQAYMQSVMDLTVTRNEERHRHGTREGDSNIQALPTREQPADSLEELKQG